MHLKRWITGLIALPVLIYIIGFGPRWLFGLLLYLVSLAGMMEFYGMCGPDVPKVVRVSGYLFGLLLFFSILFGKISFLPVIILFWAMFPMSFLVFNIFSANGNAAGNLGKALLGPVYVCLPLAMLMIIDRFPGGNIWIFFLLAVIFSSDTGAFYCGRLFGKHKLHETVSPKKTWEGAIGGLLASIVIAFWFLRILHIHRIDAGIMALVLALSISGQIGDLAESVLKRSHGIKDSGRILPGHGGILDRIDGILFAIPVLYIYLHLFVV